METTRRFPRTLAEAFPDERAACIERPLDKPDRIVFKACVAIAAVLLVLVSTGLIL